MIGGNVTEPPTRNSSPPRDARSPCSRRRPRRCAPTSASLRRETEKAKQELNGLRTAQLLEVNDQLVQAAVHADTVAQTAVSSLDELTRQTQHDELTGATTGC
jgi:hypothetical protein